MIGLTAAMAGLAVTGTAQALPRPLALTHGWQFRLDPHARGGLDAWRAGGPRGGWTPVQVPHVFDASLSPSTFHGTIGWYRLRFRAPVTPRGFGWAFKFGAVRRTATVWLNGRRIGGTSTRTRRSPCPRLGCGRARSTSSWCAS